MLSSASNIIGLTGQSNYAVWNSHMDGLARYRIAHGQKAVSLDLGTMIDDGILVETARLLDKVPAYGSLVPVTRAQLYGILNDYCKTSKQILDPDTAQLVCRISGSGDDRKTLVETPLFSRLELDNISGDSVLQGECHNKIDLRTSSRRRCLLESAQVIQCFPLLKDQVSSLLPLNYVCVAKRSIDVTFPDPPSFYDPLVDFTSFIDSMGLALDSESLIDLRSVPLEHAPLSNEVDNYHTRVSLNSRPDYDEEQSEGAHRAQSPTLLPIPLNPAAVYMPQLKITEAQRTHLVQALGPFQHLLPGFALPSRDSLTRFLNAYFDRVYPHFPFMHGPSFLPENYSLELILSMAASGAQYRYEHRKGRLLFYASKAIFHERQRHREATSCKSDILPQPIIIHTDPYSPSPTITDDIRCLLNLAIYATWQQDPEVVKGVCGLQSTLVRLLRESGLVEVNIPDSDELDWRTWLCLELDRRVKLFAFAFLNLQSIAYNLPPILLSHEINLRLPCTCEEWRAVDESNWRQFRRDIHREQSLFQDALAFLLAGKDAPSSLKPIPSPSASIILIHGLLHRILLSRQASLSGVISSDQLDIFELRSTSQANQKYSLRHTHKSIPYIQLPKDNISNSNTRPSPSPPKPRSPPHNTPIKPQEINPPNTKNSQPRKKRTPPTNPQIHKQWTRENHRPTSNRTPHKIRRRKHTRRVLMDNTQELYKKTDCISTNTQPGYMTISRVGTIQWISGREAHPKRKSWKCKVTLADGTNLKTDALVAITGWKLAPSVKYKPDGLDGSLGIPSSNLNADDVTLWKALDSQADKEILSRYPCGFSTWYPEFVYDAVPYAHPFILEKQSFPLKLEYIPFP
ncbi:unnamed protein product [Aspergillus oryzae]|uniref:Unnamed protein product n=1 Tax=Aspergillus oryzae TaxID=5062 RepID=A0AAN4YPB8_ASPOZ|nr:unnamed protein product [Aspergillus oryzae]